MATIYKCDICKKETNKELFYKIRVMNGEHPHGGQTLHKTLDFCFECLKKFNEKYTISIDEELCDLLMHFGRPKASHEKK